MRTEQKAVEYVMKYESDRGWTPRNVSKSRLFIGFDIISTKREETRTIEVKGTEKKLAIPDTAATEFTRNLTLIATHLYVVCNLGAREEKPTLHIIERKHVKKEYLTLKQTVHFSSKFEKMLPERFLAPPPIHANHV